MNEHIGEPVEERVARLEAIVDQQNKRINRLQSDIARLERRQYDE